MIRKPNTSETSPRRPRLPLAPVRAEIFQAAADLIAAGEPRELSRVLAGRFHTSESMVDRVLVLEGLRYQRTAVTLKTGIVGALEAARQAGESVLLDAEEVA